MIKFCLAVLVLPLLSACAVGPLVSHEPARTVGAAKSELIGGYGVAGYVLKYNRGLTENWDFGVHLESLSWGIRTKYAFVNGGQNEFSFAGAAGIGTSFGGSHYYGDLIASYWYKSVEPYFTYRYVRVKTDPLEFKDQNTGEVDFTIDSAEYNYGQVLLGMRWWIEQNWILSAEISSLHTYGTSLSIGSNVLAGAAFGYRFN